MQPGQATWGWNLAVLVCACVNLAAVSVCAGFSQRSICSLKYNQGQPRTSSALQLRGL